MIPRTKEHTIFQLEEAIEQLYKTVQALKSNPEYSSVDFKLDITHAYHHLNYAWNSRHLGAKRAWKAKESDFCKYRQMPEDLDLGI